MTVFICIFTVLSALFFGLAFFDYYRDITGFTGKSCSQTKFGQLCFKLFAPEKGSPAWNRLSNKLFILDSEMSITSFCLLRGLSLICGVLVALSVIGTVVFDNYKNVYAVDASVPIQFDRASYNTLVSNLTFSNEEEDELMLENNVRMLQNESFKESCNNVTTETLYSYVQKVHSRMHHIFGIYLIPLFALIVFTFYMAPRVVLNYLYDMMLSKALVEFDSLETDIAINADMSIPDILDILVVNSLFFRNMLVEFRDIYAVSSQNAYHTVFTHREFPVKFKDLIHYLEMLETQGPAYVQDTIDFSKSQSQEEIIAHYKQAALKRIKRPKFLCAICFLIAIARIFAVMFYMMAEHFGGDIPWF